MFGSIPRSIYIVLEDDLVDSCKAGDDVVVCGTVLRRWKPTREGERCEIEIIIKANSIHVKYEKNVDDMKQEMGYEFRQYWKEHLKCPMLGR